MRRLASPLAALAACALAVSCLDEVGLAPTVGAPLQERCSDEDTNPDVAVSFQRDILEGIILRPIGGCVACHSPSASNPLGFTVGGLDLSSFAGLMHGGVNSGSGIVVAGEPCRSILYQKLSPGPPYGARMPMNGPPFLTPTELATVHDWIAEGALDN